MKPNEHYEHASEGAFLNEIEVLFMIIKDLDFIFAHCNRHWNKHPVLA